MNLLRESVKQFINGRVEWIGFDYDYSFDYGFAYTYDNRKGPHKQSLIVKCLSDFQNIKNI